MAAASRNLIVNHVHFHKSTPKYIITLDIEICRCYSDSNISVRKLTLHFNRGSTEYSQFE
jgi:hypothetical protein